MMKNFSFKDKPANVLNVEIDRKSIKEICYEKNKCSFLNKKELLEKMNKLA